MDATLIVGLGGAGCDIADHLHGELGVRAVAISSDQEGLAKCAISEKLLIGPRTCQGMAAVGVDRGKRAADESKEALQQLLSGVKNLILVAGLGGGTGTGAAPVIARMAREMGMNVLAVVTLPFSFETGRRGQALIGLSELLGTGVELLVYDHNEGLPEFRGDKRSLETVLDEAKEKIAVQVGDRLGQK